MMAEIMEWAAPIIVGLATGWALAQITPDWLFDRLLGKRGRDE